MLEIVEGLQLHNDKNTSTITTYYNLFATKRAERCLTVAIRASLVGSLFFNIMGKVQSQADNNHRLAGHNQCLSLPVVGDHAKSGRAMSMAWECNIIDIY